MKLKNKRTGEIATLTLSTNGEDMIIMGNDMYAHITKLSELKDYEDYEEPKEYWFIRDHTSSVGYAPADNNATAKYRKEIVGNYFETKEEAEKAVRKLKAWKRLKDKGFRFKGKTYETDKRFGYVFYKVDEDTYSEDVIAELDLLFGGEE